MKHLGKVLIAAGALAFSALSHAGPLVEFWDVTTTGTWDSPVPGSVNNTGKVLSWGTGNQGPSTLTITDPGVQHGVKTYLGQTPPQLSPYLANSVTLTHDNNPINGNSLTSVTLQVAMTVKATTPSGISQDLQTINYGIKFVETTNSWNNPSCPVPSSPINNPCNDIFVQVGGLLNEKFLYDGNWYYVNAFPLDGTLLDTLDPQACAAAGMNSGCIGFTTVEGQLNKLPFGLTISTTPLQVPEPGSLALIGLALAGAGLISRRRRNA